jgi:hypothetical protein
MREYTRRVGHAPSLTAPWPGRVNQGMPCATSAYTPAGRQARQQRAHRCRKPRRGGADRARRAVRSGLAQSVLVQDRHEVSLALLLLNELPFSGYGETASAFGEVIKGGLHDWTSSYYEQVYQFPSASAATSIYWENYQFSARCDKASVTSGGKTTTWATQSLTTGHVDGGLAFFRRAATGTTGFPDSVNYDEWAVVGQYVYNVDAFYDIGQPRLTPNAATRELIARVLAG